MKSHILIFMAACAALSAIAAPRRTALKPMTPEEKEAMFAKHGGLVRPPSNGKSILIYDARGIVDTIPEDFIKKTRRTLFVPFTVKRGTIKDIDLANVVRGLKTEMTPAVILLVDKPGLPTLGIFPEDSCGYVNVALLKDSDSERYALRMQKELSRVMGFALGAYQMPQPGCSLVPISDVNELDAMKATQLSPLRNMSIYNAIASLDVKSDREVPYSLAVRQGWAPAPTNDVQKAICDRIKALKEKPKVDRVSK